MTDSPRLDALRLQIAKQRFENGMTELRAKSNMPAVQPLSDARRRELLSLTPFGHSVVRHGDDARARGERPNPSGLSDKRRRELLGMTPSGNAMLVKEDVARARDGR